MDYGTIRDNIIDEQTNRQIGVMRKILLELLQEESEGLGSE